MAENLSGEGSFRSERKIMLYSFDTLEYVDRIPHKTDYDVWKARLSEIEFQAMRDELTRRISTDEIHTSSWIPGNDWAGTVFMPIYQKATLYNEEQAAMCFGLILWELLMQREEIWGFGRYEKGGVPIKGLTYFRVYNPPSR